MPEPRAGGGRRETRLLLATIAVSVGMLLLLARFRFPDEAGRQAAEPAPAPLERLAARATYDELAGIMADLERRILPSIVTLAGQGSDRALLVPAVRLTPDRAVALLSGDLRVTSTAAAPAPTVVLRDTVRELVVVDVGLTPDSSMPPAATAGRPGPRYVAVVEATSGPPAVRPVYIGRTDLFPDPRWADPLMTVAAVQQSVSPGAAVFSLDGSFIGLASSDGGRVTIVPAATLRSVVSTVPSGPPTRADLPFEVQPLTPALGRAAGADKGVMVTTVQGAEAAVAPGDVVRSIDGIGITSVGGFAQVAQTRAPGATVTIEIIRRGQARTVTMTAVDAHAAPGPASGQDVGAVLRAVPGAGAEVVIVDPSSAADRAGLKRGDVIVGLDGTTAPEPAAIVREYRAAKPGAALLLTIRRDGDHRVLALERR